MSDLLKVLFIVTLLIVLVYGISYISENLDVIFIDLFKQFNDLTGIFNA